MDRPPAPALIQNIFTKDMKTNFPSQPFVFGIDISKATFDVSLTGSWSSYRNNQEGFKRFFRYISGITAEVEQVHCVMEATGPYFVALASYLFTKGVIVFVANPKSVRHFASSKLSRVKTDRKDAELIAEYGTIMTMKPWQPRSPQISQLHELFRLNQQLIKQQTATKNASHAASTLPEPNSIAQQIRQDRLAADKQILNRVQQEIDKIIAAEYRVVRANLCSVPGIGPKSSAMLIVATNNFSRFESSKQLVAYIGLNPRIEESGTSVKKKMGISKMGNSKVLSTLYVCAISAIRSGTEFRAFYNRLRERGKPHKVAVVAVAAKLVRIAWAIGKTGTKYKPWEERKSEKSFAF